MENENNIYKPYPFWSWNDELDEKELVSQIDWMHENGIGGFFMHARGGLLTPYLGEKWFSCVRACLKRAKELNMEAYAYDENGWPSGFVGGELLKDDNNKDAYLTFSISKYDPDSYVSYDLSNEKILRINKDIGKDCLNVYMHLSTSTADTCNKEVVKKFINLTHEQYKKNDIYHNLRGFFTDEPQYYRWDNAYSRVLIDYFKDKYNEDLLNKLGLLFVEKEGYREFRYKYYLAMQDLLLNSFGKQIYDWCDENNYKLTGHYVEETSFGLQLMCCGGVMPFYEYEHIPGIDWLGRNIHNNDLSPKQLGSVATQLGKKQTLAEVFACVGWDATPYELKHIAEYLMVNGVNLLCYHLLPYSEHGQRKRDYPEHYSKINPWVNKNFIEFNDYFTKLGEKLSNSKEIVNVGILSSLRSCYFHFKKNTNEEDFGCKSIDLGFFESINELSKYHIPYHIIDETILEKHCQIMDNSIIIGECKYDYLIIPKGIETMGKFTEKVLREYVKNGGRILLLGDKPRYLEGEEYNYEYLTSNISMNDIISSLDFASSVDQRIRLTYRVDNNNNKFVYVVNLSNENVIFDLKFKGFSCFDTLKDIIGNKLYFEPYESKLLYLSNKEITHKKTLKPLYLDNKFIISEPVNNYLTLDNVQYSFDNVSFSKPLNYMGAFMDLLEKRYNGKLYLKYTFNVDKVPQKLFVLLENTNIIKTIVNGSMIKTHTTILEKNLFKYDIHNLIHKGINDILLEINFIENELVYYALFGENVQESIKNCLAYPTTIEAIYLVGDFGVDGNFKNGTNNKCRIGNNFIITSQKSEIEDIILDGFPFFRGDISLEQNIKVDDINYELIIPQRFQLIDLFVNNKFVRRIMFEHKVDISNSLKIGQNNIKLVVSVSNRNLLGPFHTEQEENENVGPYIWERLKTWNNGESLLLKSDYAFVKTFPFKK